MSDKADTPVPDTPVTVAYDGDLAIVTVDNPPVNALRHAVRQGLWDAADEIDASAAKAAVLICAGRTFIAGADIREFDMAPMPPGLTQVVDRIENGVKPWVAAIHGTALGGGLEVALGCHYRVAAPTGKMGVPEVHLGIIPGAGGTQRLPRIMGAAAAAQMVTTGVPIGAAEALDAGLISEIIEGDLGDGARAFARKIAGKPVPRPEQGPAKGGPSATEWAMMRMAVEKKAKGQLSPVAGLDAVRKAFESDLADGLKLEVEKCLALKDTDQSAALRHAFFSERAVAKPAVIKGASPREVNKVAVIGGGLMGSGIATSLLQAGAAVVMIEMSEEAAEAGRARVEANLASALKRGLIDDDKKAKMMAALTPATDYAATAGCDLAIEAVFEDMGVKQDVFAKLNAAMGADAILASNTSYLDPNEIGKDIPNKSRILGMHFH